MYNAHGDGDVDGDGDGDGRVVINDSIIRSTYSHVFSYN